MYAAPGKAELEKRICRLHDALTQRVPDWDRALVVDKVNQYYLTGTRQEGVFALSRDGAYAYFIRRSLERARRESPLSELYPMNSYQDLLGFLGHSCPKLCVETETFTLGMMSRLRKYIEVGSFLPLDAVLLSVRAIKSPYEIAVMEESGRQHKVLLEEVVPSLLREGMSEAELTAEMYPAMIALGFHGVTRFSMFQTEIVNGQIAFGDNSLYPSCFNGPGGMEGMSPAVPIVGSRARRLAKGDLVFVDVGYGVHGYHTDRTQIYRFGAPPTEDMLRAHRACRALQEQAASLLRPGNTPEEIYQRVMDSADLTLLPNLKGYGGNQVKFLGHGVGLYVDEYPVIAPGFKEPLVENMVLAIEPKNGIDGVGLVGVEDTYLVTKDGGRCLTGGEKDIIVV